MQQARQPFFSASFFHDMLPLAIPIALQNLLMCSFRLVDTLMIGQLGDTSIAAVGLAGQLSFLIELIVFGFASGASVFIAQYHGAGNRDGILRSFGATALFSVPVGLIASAAGFFFPDAVLRLFTNDPALVAEGARYMRFACFSYLGLTLYQPMAVTLRSTEQVRIPMITSIVAAACNAVLNYVFIFGLFGLPAMGVAGAGLATAVSGLINPLLILCISIRRRNILIAPLGKLLALGGFLPTYFARVLPVLANEGLWSLSVLGINMVYGRMGADNYAAFTVFRTVENLVFVFFVGICNACNILVGKRIGAGEFDEAKRYAGRFMALIPLMSLVLGLGLILARGAVLSLFDISDTARATAMGLMLLYSIALSLIHVPYLGVVGIFRAGGDTRFGLYMDVAVQYLLLLPAAFVCGLVWKLPFLWTSGIGVFLEGAVKCVVVITHFLRMKWIRPVTAIPELTDYGRTDA